MREKLNVEKFRELRQKINNILINAEGEIEKQGDRDDFDEEEFTQEFLKQIFPIQDEILSCDLSDIPFEEWQDFTIYSTKEKVADFSLTHANLDFSIINYYGNGNFKGCNVKNLDSIKRFVSSDSFDEEVIKENSNLFLSDGFPQEFKEKYYSNSLIFSDFVFLNDAQLLELENKLYYSHMIFDSQYEIILGFLGLLKTVQLYNYSKEDFNYIIELVNSSSYSFSRLDNSKQESITSFLGRIKDNEVSSFRELINQYYRNNILIYSSTKLDIDSYPKEFVTFNQDLFLVGRNVPFELLDRYYNRNLTYEDIVNNQELFRNIPIDNFIIEGSLAKIICDTLGFGNFQKALSIHPDVIEYVMKNEEGYKLLKYYDKNSDDFEKCFRNAVKNYIVSHSLASYDKSSNTIIPPVWAKSFDFKYINKIETIQHIQNLDENTIILDEFHKQIVNALKVQNIKKFDRETGFFSHYNSSNLDCFNALSFYLSGSKRLAVFEKCKDYDEFVYEIANVLEEMRLVGRLSSYLNYDFITGDFREQHSDLFIDSSAPQELKDAFYGNKINFELILKNPNFKVFLLHKNLSKALISHTRVKVKSQNENNPYEYLDFLSIFTKKHSNEEFFKLLDNYGSLISNLEFESSMDRLDNVDMIYQDIDKGIYEYILSNRIKALDLKNNFSFVCRYPDIFIDLSNCEGLSLQEKNALEELFYSRNISFDYIKKYPSFKEILKDKNLCFAFNLDKYIPSNNGKDSVTLSSLLYFYGNAKFLELCDMYGNYLTLTISYLSNYMIIENGKILDLDFYKNGVLKELSFDEVKEKIGECIVKCSLNADIPYFPDDFPDSLKNKHPELFLSDDAPRALVDYFYNVGNAHNLTFELLSKHKEWLPYLKGKSVKTALLRNRYLKEDTITYFDLFGDKALKLGIARGHVVNKMIKSGAVSAMKDWYDKTGCRFIPDNVVMQNFSLSDVDKFLEAGTLWSSLMKNKEYSSDDLYREAILKAAYCFGVFERDQKGFQALKSLISDLPRNLDSSYLTIFNQIDEIIDKCSQRRYFYGNDVVLSTFENGSEVMSHVLGELSESQKDVAYQNMLEYVRDTEFSSEIPHTILVQFFESLKEEKVPIDYSIPIFKQLYKVNENGYITFTLNSQKYPKTCAAINTILHTRSELPIMSPSKANFLFGGFKLEYNPDFRKFFLDNLDEFFSDNKYIFAISTIQRRFNEIKVANSNRVLTLDLAVNYIKDNAYSNVDVGNMHVSEVVAIAGYSQEDFETLQKVYNYGKQRTYSSIPRVAKKYDKYQCEILRLDDPLAMTIGKLCDCCQKLNDNAETCMVHSMIDKNGRVFVVRDNLGNIVAQSWVWRNKDTLCFDNIEIPDRAFTRALKDNDYDTREQFVEEVYNIYKDIAHVLIEQDEASYKKLLDEGKITLDQYEGLRLGKVTVGLGYNDVKTAIEKNAKEDNSELARPKKFTSPLTNKEGLYTSDSTTQYILDEREGRVNYEGGELYLYNDSVSLYTDETLDKRNFLELCKLEIVTKNTKDNLKLNQDYYDSIGNIAPKVSSFYELNSFSFKVAMNPNFAIIFGENNGVIKVVDFFYNTKISNDKDYIDITDKVLLQVKNALNEIQNGKSFDITELDETQKEMFNRALTLNEELDVERGISHAK